jgi:2-polyprenyl-6-methoxyphenol hydroxylase-like FAD-dependent oxidoreductase
MTVDPRGVWTFVSLHEADPAADPATWRFMILMTWPEGLDTPEEQGALLGNEEAILARVRRLAEPLASPFGQMVRGIPEGTRVWYGRRLGYWETSEWDGKGGRVTLVGDAAHSLTFRGLFFSS